MNEQERQRIATVGSAFLGKVAQRLQTLQPEELSAADVARWTDVALKLQQAGQPHTGYDREARLAESHVDDLPITPPDVRQP